ncbi:MAG TPA: VOC family protein [Polyangiaceae bacterium]|nr:VOC family protein [Polyangiaceae bacterium]
MQIEGLKVLFVAGFGPLVRDPAESRKFYFDSLGLPLEAMPHDDTYLHSEKIDGVRHFAMWPLKEAAQSCFGKREWPEAVPTPHSWIEFDVEDVASASAVLKQRGYTLLVDNREEPWGQTVTRLLSPEGILVGITFTPWLRK